MMLSPNVSAAAELGVGFTVLPNGDNSKVGNNNQLWFALDAGEMAKRRFQLTSASSLVQNVNISFVKSQIVDGSAIATTEKSEFADWFGTSVNDFKLGSRESKSIDLAVKAPNKIEDGTYRLFLKISVTDSSKPVKGKSGTYGIVNNAVSFYQDIYVVIGDANNLVLDFNILSIEDFQNLDGEKYLLVNLENIGNLPLGLSGNIELISMDFEGLKFGPFNAGSSPMLSKNSKGKIVFQLGKEIEPGNYKILVQVKQSEILKNKIFEENLEFPIEGSRQLPLLFVLIIGIALSVILLRIGINQFRKPKELSIDAPEKINFKFKLKKPAKNQSSPLEQMSIEELEALIENRTKESNKLTQKAAVKKATKKKAVAKKAAKNPVKKAAKQAATKPTAKSGSKKVAKKTVKKRAKQATKGSR